MNPPAPAERLRAYDEQLRTDAEVLGAEHVQWIGPVLLATFPTGRGFVTYRDLGGLDGLGVSRLVADVVEQLRDDPSLREAEWKTRGHDHAPGLDDALRAAGFSPEEPESVMVGDLAGLVDAPAPPEGVVLRRIDDPSGVEAMVRMQAEVFGDRDAVVGPMTAELVARLDDPDVELWVAEAEGRIVAAGRLQAVPGSAFVGIWGGATLPAWRGRGVYRALTAARARSGLARGKRWAHSDSTAMSRPILERSGLVAVTTTTPYHWRREG